MLGCGGVQPWPELQKYGGPTLHSNQRKTTQNELGPRHDERQITATSMKIPYRLEHELQKQIANPQISFRPLDAPGPYIRQQTMHCLPART